MLKLILIFRSVLWPQAFLVQRTHLFQLKQQFTYFFKYYPVENKQEQTYFLKKELWMSYVRSFYINPVQ